MIVSAAEELTGDGLPGEVGVLARVTTPTELEHGPDTDLATTPLDLVVAGRGRI